MEDIEEIRKENVRLRALLASASVVRIALEPDPDGALFSWIVTAIGVPEERLLNEIKDVLIGVLEGMAGSKVETDGVARPVGL